MKLEHTDEQRELAEMAASFLRATPEEEIFGGLAGLGLLGLAVSEESGGAGAGVVELSLVAREVGRLLPAIPFAASAVLATSLLCAAEGREAKELVQRLVTGELVGTSTWPTVDPRPCSPELRLDDGRVTGTVAHVPFGAQAGVLLARAMDPRGSVHLVAVDPGAARVDDEQPFDLSEPTATVAFGSVPAVVLCLADEPIRAARTRILTVLAAELLGTGEAVLATAVDYAKTRFQFNRAIGSFQAVKHMLVDAYMALDAASALVHRAAVGIDEGDASAERLARFAFTAASNAAELSARNSMQTFGGIGYTLEQGTHRFLRRARARIAAFGSVDLQLASISDDLFERRSASA